MRACRILITGASGQLGTDLAALIESDGLGRYDAVAATHAQLDVGERDQVMAAVTGLQPDVIFHLAAWTAVDLCESDPDRAWRDNTLACRYVAEAAGATGAHLVTVSTDYVFDGSSDRPYTEWDQTNPVSVYGRSKLAGEHEVLQLLPACTVVRTSWVCGQHGHNFVKTILRLAESAQTLRIVDDQHGCPTFTDDLATMLLRLGIARRPGLFHATNQGATTWYELARDIVGLAGRDRSAVEPIPAEALQPPRPARRPANSVLDNAALRLGGIAVLPDYHEPLERTVKALIS